MVPEKIASMIGKAGDVRIFEVEKGAIKKYADAVGESNPLYWDEDQAKKLGYDSLIAPPGFFGWPTKWTEAMPFSEPLQATLMAILAEEGYPRILDGGIEYEFFKPIVAGDTLAALPRVVNVTERDGKTGKMFFFSLETTYTNQRGDLVARVRKTVIAR